LVAVRHTEVHCCPVQQLAELMIGLLAFGQTVVDHRSGERTR
jgi:hypothetical protein